MSAIDPNEVPLLLSTDNEGRSPHTSGPRLTRKESSRRRGQAREGLVHSLFRNRKAVAGLIILTAAGRAAASQ